MKGGTPAPVYISVIRRIRIDSMFDTLKADLEAYLRRDPAARNKAEVFFLYSGYKAVRKYRRAHWFQLHHMKFIARWLSQRARHKTGVEIHPGATIGKGLVIDHGMGVVIGETTVIGDNCLIYQNEIGRASCRERVYVLV